MPSSFEFLLVEPKSAPSTFHHLNAPIVPTMGHSWNELCSRSAECVVRLASRSSTQTSFVVSLGTMVKPSPACIVHLYPSFNYCILNYLFVSEAASEGIQVSSARACIEYRSYASRREHSRVVGCIIFFSEWGLTFIFPFSIGIIALQARKIRRIMVGFLSPTSLSMYFLSAMFLDILFYSFCGVSSFVSAHCVWQYWTLKNHNNLLHGCSRPIAKNSSYAQH